MTWRANWGDQLSDEQKIALTDQANEAHQRAELEWDKNMAAIPKELLLDIICAAKGDDEAKALSYLTPKVNGIWVAMHAARELQRRANEKRDELTNKKPR